MQRTLMALTIAVAVLALGGVASYAQAPAPAQHAAAAKATMHMVSGKITKFDSASNVLTISTGKGDEDFTLGSSTTIHDGSKVIASADLSGLIGHEVTVHLSGSGSQQMTTSVVVSVPAAKAQAKAEAPAAAPKPAKPAATAGY
jgi:hypothetical protein